ncbi:hypothetical protein ACYATP_00105 [Lactobacillaceae bacterium Melli_B4]
MGIYGQNKPDSIINGNITMDQLKDVYAFNNEFENSNGYLRAIREGGFHKRNAKEISQNNIEGKIAEFAVYNLMTEHRIHFKNDKGPSLWTGGKGSFDSGYDLTVIFKNGKEVNLEIKSSTLNAKSLMLEEKRWTLNNDNIVINNDHTGKKAPDAFIAVNVGKSIYNGKLTVPDIFISGVLLYKDLEYCILNKKSLFRKYIPTAYKKMNLDAPNYIFPYYYGKVNEDIIASEFGKYDYRYIHKLMKPRDGLNAIREMKHDI